MQSNVAVPEVPVKAERSTLFPALKSCGGATHRIALLAALTVACMLPSLRVEAQDLNKKQSALLATQSGFLTNYSRLKPDEKNPNLLIYSKDLNDLKSTTKFIIQPVEVYLLPEGDQRAIKVADLTHLTDTFTQAIKDQLTAGGFEVVTEPGPGVMILRLALTNVEPTNSKENAAVTGATTAASLTVAPGIGLVVPRLSVGKVSIEGEIVNATSGVVEVDFMTSKAGRRYFSGLKPYQTWGDINAAFKSWAENFRERLTLLQTT